MTREEFLSMLTRAVQDDLITEDEAKELLRAFDAGELDEEDFPEPIPEIIEETDESHMLGILAVISASILGAGLLARGRARDQFQDRFEQRVRDLAFEPINIREWERRFAAEVRDHILTQAVIGNGGPLTPERLQEVSEVIREQQAYVTRFADERAVKQMLTDVKLKTAGVEEVDAILEVIDKATAEEVSLKETAPEKILPEVEKAAEIDERVSKKAVAARSVQYGGAARGEWFHSAEDDSDDNIVYEYLAVDDDNTCVECLQAEIEGPYLPNEGKFPGVECLGRGRCRCIRVPRIDPEKAAELRENAGEVVTRGARREPRRRARFRN